MTLPSDPGARHIPLPEDGDWYAPDEHLHWLTRRGVGPVVLVHERGGEGDPEAIRGRKNKWRLGSRRLRCARTGNAAASPRG